jgi:hypothetical protein
MIIPVQPGVQVQTLVSEPLIIGYIVRLTTDQCDFSYGGGCVQVPAALRKRVRQQKSRRADHSASNGCG